MVHFTHSYIMEPTHPITVTVVGVGGNGTQALTDLAKINSSLLSMNHPGLHVIAIDDDIVTESNIGRQKFSEVDLDCYKASVLITRLNRFYGTTWVAINEKFSKEKYKGSNIIISCVDNVKTRKEISKCFKKPKSQIVDYHFQLYWLDFGNSKDFGQFVLGSNRIQQPKLNDTKCINKLKNVFDLFPNMDKNEELNTPSCSTREALLKQDLFINSILVSNGMNLIWKLIKDFHIQFHGGFINLKNGEMKPIKIM